MKLLDDEKIIALFEERNEMAITETKTKYGRYCNTIAYQILQNREDAEECENDTYLDAWNTIPPTRPRMLSIFLGTITRRISLDRLKRKTAEKRGGGEAMLSLHELEECIPSGKSIDDTIHEKTLAKLISDFLRTLSEAESNIFLRRYWYFDSIDDICKRYGYGQSKVKTTLKRTRDKLLQYLNQEEVYV